MILFLLACAPIEVFYLQGATQTITLYDTGGPADDTALPEGDSDSAPIEDSEPSQGGDSDSEPIETDADGDGYGSSSDCDDSDASIHPGGDESTDDDKDNDCDGEIDEDYDACAVAFGWAEFSSDSESIGNGYSMMSVQFDGVATVCAVACDAWWLSAEIWDETNTAVALPYFMEDRLFMEVWAYDPGVDTDTGTCTITTSAGDISIDIVWNG